MKHLLLFVLLGTLLVGAAGCSKNIRLEENRDSNQGVQIH